MRPVRPLMMLAVVGLAWIGAGCESPPPAGPATPQTRPTQSPGETGAADSRPAASRPTEPGPTSRPADETGPEYLVIVERLDPAGAAHASASTVGTQRLSVNTTNVKRLRIERRRVPLKTTGSIALELDGQVFEWVARSDVVDFEFSPNGGWQPIKAGER